MRESWQVLKERGLGGQELPLYLYIRNQYKDPNGNYLSGTDDCEILQQVGGSRLLSVKTDIYTVHMSE